MIVFDLECRTGGHAFEGWFSSSTDFMRQQECGLLVCPECGSEDVGKAVMAPNVGRKGNQLATTTSIPPTKPQPMVNQGVLPPEAVQVMQKLATMQAEMLKKSRWVGEKFAEDARAMHYGERAVEIIHGQATPAEAEDLLEEGIEVAPLPFPIAPPGKAN